MIKSSNWSDGYPDFHYNDAEATVLCRWLRSISATDNVFNTRKALTILKDKMDDPATSRLSKYLIGYQV